MDTVSLFLWLQMHMRHTYIFKMRNSVISSSLVSCKLAELLVRNADSDSSGLGRSSASCISNKCSRLFWCRCLQIVLWRDTAIGMESASLRTNFHVLFYVFSCSFLCVQAPFHVLFYVFFSLILEYDIIRKKSLALYFFLNLMHWIQCLALLIPTGQTETAANFCSPVTWGWEKG